MDKKVLITSALLIVAGFFAFNHFCRNNGNNISESISNGTVKEEKNIEISKPDLVKKETAEVKKVSVSKTDIPALNSKEKIKKGSLYNNYSNNSLPLSAMSEISSLPDNIKDVINNVIETSNGVFMITKNHDKVLMVVDNNNNIRHGVEFVEISTKTGQQTITSLGYIDKMKDSDNDNWEYDEVTKKPVKHIIYDKNGDVEYIETWNYSEESPVKYEMKNGEGKTISIKKETLDNDSNDLRIEHLIYDKEGHTKVNVSASYEGADIKRFTYYNADKLSDSGSVFGEYKDGEKVKETVYTSDLKVKNVYTSEYSNGERTDIKVFDSQNNEIEKIINE